MTKKEILNVLKENKKQVAFVGSGIGGVIEEYQFDDLAEQIVKLCSMPIVGQSFYCCIPSKLCPKCKIQCEECKREGKAAIICCSTVSIYVRLRLKARTID